MILMQGADSAIQHTHLDLAVGNQYDVPGKQPTNSPAKLVRQSRKGTAEADLTGGTEGS